MSRWVNSSPVLFAQPLEIKNRQRFRRFKSIAEKMSNLLGDRSVLALRSSLELPVKRVGKVLDVQYCHWFTPKLLHSGGTIGDVSRPLLAPKNFPRSAVMQCKPRLNCWGLSAREPQTWPTRSARSNQLNFRSMLVLFWPTSSS